MITAWLMLAALAAPLPAPTLDLTFETQGRSGEVVVAIFDSEQAWRKRDAPVRTLRTRAGQPLRVEGLAAGSYGIMAFLDRNGDGRLNTLPIGLPTEPYGFSQNARGTFGPPSWRAAAFNLDDGSAAQSIRLR